MPSEVCLSSTSTNSSTTEATCVLLTLAICVIAKPSFCTSFALSCLSTSAASCSPSDIRSTAARCVLLSEAGAATSGIVVHPVLHDLRDFFRILARRRFGDFQFVVVAAAAIGDARLVIDDAAG